MVNVNIDEVVAADLQTFKRVIGLLEQYYTAPTVTPSTTIEKIMYDAGQFSVLQNMKEVIARVETEQKVIKEV